MQWKTLRSWVPVPTIGSTPYIAVLSVHTPAIWPAINIVKKIKVMYVYYYILYIILIILI